MSEDASVSPVFRVTYGRYADVRADATSQIARGGLLVRVPPIPSLHAGQRAKLTLVLPDGVQLSTAGEILNLLPGHGVAVSTPVEWMDEIRKAVAWKLDEASSDAPPHHEMILDRPPRPTRERAAEPPVAPPALTTPVAGSRAATEETPVKLDSLSNAEKLHLALHGNRDERNAILRDKNRQLHTFVLRNPQITIEDVVTMAKNPQLSPDLLKQIGERSDWVQRSAVALALVRNPKTPPDVAVRALDHVSRDVLRQFAKGMGAPPHITAAARKRVIPG